MGIPRWTQDLTPYLDSAVIARTPSDDPRLLIQRVVIDGPSLVYHVYNTLIASTSTVNSGYLNVPTYVQLNAAVDVFLTDLESCGATIEKIFFDGALPHPKRTVRVDRLEKTRLQLERMKVLGPPPRSNSPSEIDKSQLSTMLWQIRPTASKSSTWTAPFIVPSTIEYFKQSKWSDCVSVVNGEAETFCASIAKETDAAVLSNDSDLTLLDDMQHGQVVGLLHSLSMTCSSDGAPLTIGLQCWCPSRIATKLNVHSLLRTGFERSKDPTASFASILQRSLQDASRQDTTSTDFTCFMDQFGAQHATTMTSLRRGLNDLDPRLAELICQLPEAEERVIIHNRPLWITLPVLLEDSGKDASWSYGYETRRLACSLLLASRSHMQNYSSITELSRKGQRITQDLVEIIDPQNLADAIGSFMLDVAILPRPSNRTTKSKVVSSYILWALRSVLKQRAMAKKNVMPSITIREYLGLGNIHSRLSTKSKKTPSDHEEAWRLVHLNSNIQSALYSLRILRQICIWSHKVLITVSWRKEFLGLVKLLEPMPGIEDLFLGVDEIKYLMRQSPMVERERVLDEVCPDSRPIRAQPLPRADQGIAFTQTTSKAIRKRKKQRKHTGNHDSQDKQTAAQQDFSSNPFDLLAEKA